MKVAVIGKGTSSIITTLVLLDNGHDVTVFYDPKAPHINVGESTTPIIGKLISKVLGFTIHDLVESEFFSYKMGITFVNWGVGKKFQHLFEDNNIAHHFVTEKFNDFISDFLKKYKNVKYIPERIETLQYYDNKLLLFGDEYDFMVNCAGWDNHDCYYDPIIETVNSAILFRKKYDNYDDRHTLHIATEDGWQFGLPFPQEDTFKCGYLFNSNFTSKEDALKKIPEDSEITGEYFWKPRYAKNLFFNHLIAHNGNRLFFFEPLQALTLHYVYEMALLICEYLQERNQYNYDRINHLYHMLIYNHQMCLAYHYQFGSVFDSKYWNEVTSQARLIMETSEHGSGEKFINTIKYDLKYKNDASKFGSMNRFDHVYLQRGMTNSTDF